MKKKKWFVPMAIVLCVMVFAGYRLLDRVTADSKAPEIIFEDQQLLVSALEDDAVLLTGVSAVDAKDGDVSDSLVVESVRIVDSAEGTVNAAYAAFDRAGNVAKAERQVTFTDYVSPRFKLNGALIYTENSGLDVLSAISAEDMVDGNISHWIRLTNLDESNTTTAGEHQIEFRVTNSLGDQASITLPVEVYATGTYQGRLELSDYLVYLKTGDVFNAAEYPKQYTLYGVTYPLRASLDSSISLKTVGTVDTGTPGLYAVSYYVTLGENTGYSKLFVVVEG